MTNWWQLFSLSLAIMQFGSFRNHHIHSVESILSP